MAATLLVLWPTVTAALAHGNPTLRFHTRALSASRAATARSQLPARPAIDPVDVQIIQRQFAAVREIPRIRDALKAANATNLFEIDDYVEPSFRRLFTHKTWKRYTGESSLKRFLQLFRKWPFCRVMQSTWPVVALFTLWATLVALLAPTRLLNRLFLGLGNSLTLQGTAIGLLVVFRTDNAYRRLEEARQQWGRIVHLTREIVTKCVVSLEYPVVCDVARLLCAYSWALRDKLRTKKKRDDILQLLLDKDEFNWVSVQRSRPLALLGRVRQILYREFETGELPPTQHYMIDLEVGKLDEVVSNCERLFSSPIPPNMARHGMRSLILWLLGLPFMLAGQLPWYMVALCVATTSYIYLGIDELGVQVEQPFEILPLWQLCHLVQFNIEEALASPEVPLRIKRDRQTDVPLAERYDIEEDDIEEADIEVAVEEDTSATTQEAEDDASVMALGAGKVATTLTP